MARNEVVADTYVTQARHLAEQVKVFGNVLIVIRPIRRRDVQTAHCCRKLRVEQEHSLISRNLQSVTEREIAQQFGVYYLMPSLADKSQV